MTDPSGVTGYAYDPLGRLSQVQHTPSGQPALTTHYAWNNAGHLSGLTLPSGQQLSYSYWNRRITEIQLNGQPLIGPVYYRPHGGVDGYAYNGGSWHYHAYDLDGRMSGQQAGAFFKSYHYDPAGRLIEATDNAPARSQTYQYDNLNRLTQSIFNSTVWGYDYDANGNRSGGHSAWTPSIYTTATTSNRLLQRDGTSFTYDAAGNQIVAGGQSHTYDSVGRRTASTLNGVTTTYRYNAHGQRTEKAQGTQRVRFVYDSEGHLIGEYNANAQPLREYIYLGDTPVALLDYSNCRIKGPGSIIFPYNGRPAIKRSTLSGTAHPTVPVSSPR